MKKISVLGCGWLGIPLCEALLADGFEVSGSTTSKHKIPLLSSKGITPFSFSVGPDGIEGNPEAFFDADVLVIDIPPRFHFPQKIATLLPYIAASGIAKVMLISSVSVYGQTDGTLTESNEPMIRSDRSKQLYDAENLLRDNPGFKSTIVRFGGLIGPRRHPVRQLAGQIDLENPHAPVNLIHLADCIGIIKAVIQTDTWGETFNAVAPWHPSRERYYTQKALDFSLEPPRFNHATPSAGKTIGSEKLQQRLGYAFEFPEL